MRPRPMLPRSRSPAASCSAVIRSASVALAGARRGPRRGAADQRRDSSSRATGARDRERLVRGPARAATSRSTPDRVDARRAIREARIPAECSRLRSARATQAASASRADDVAVAGGAQISATAEGVGPRRRHRDPTRRARSSSRARARPGRRACSRARAWPVTRRQTGDGGDILIVAAPSSSVNDGAEISTQTFGAGAAGGIQIVAAESVRRRRRRRRLAPRSTRRPASGERRRHRRSRPADLRVDDGADDLGEHARHRRLRRHPHRRAARLCGRWREPERFGPAGIFAQSLTDTGPRRSAADARATSRSARASSARAPKRSGVDLGQDARPAA